MHRRKGAKLSQEIQEDKEKVIISNIQEEIITKKPETEIQTASLELIESTLTPANEENETLKEVHLDEITIDITEANIEVESELKAENTLENNESVKTMTETQVEKLDVSTTDDFKLFYSQYNSAELFDNFVICAYFIKNNLKQQEFTIKFLNSKLFQATGKIADLSIVDQLIANELLMTFETEDSRKYCITSSGEEYFIKKFQ